MKFLKRWVRNWLTDDEEDFGMNTPSKLKAYDDPKFHGSGVRTVNFRVYAAIGGSILEVRRWNDNALLGSDEDTKLYIISEGEDVGASISKIITLESLR